MQRAHWKETLAELRAMAAVMGPARNGAACGCRGWCGNLTMTYS